MSTVAPIDDMAMHMVFRIWGTPVHTGNMPDFLSYLSKHKVMGKDLAPIEKCFYDDCFYSTDLLDLILTHSLPIDARTKAKAYLVAREDF